MDVEIASGQSLMRRGVARRAFGVLGVLALAVVTAGCFIADSSSPQASPQAQLTDAEFVEYDGEVLTVRADLVNDGSSGNSSVAVWFACVEVEGRDRPCFYEYVDGRYVDELGLDDSALHVRAASLRYEAESARIMSGSYRFGYWQGDEGEGVAGGIYWNCRVSSAVLEGCTARQDQDTPPLERQGVDIDFAELENAGGGASLEPEDEIQILFRFRVPDLMTGAGLKFYWRDSQVTLLEGDEAEPLLSEITLWDYWGSNVDQGTVLEVPGLADADAEFVEYDGEVLTVRAELVNENSEYSTLIEAGSVWIQEAGRDERHFADSAQIMLGSYTFWTNSSVSTLLPMRYHGSWVCAVENTVLQLCRASQDILRIEVTQVDFDFADVNNFSDQVLYLDPNDSVQILYRVRIPELMPGEVIKFHGVAYEHYPQNNKPPVELVVE